MSKYGFNENEVVKTIITKIDKDGFHKQEVFEGDVDEDSSDITYVTMTVGSDGSAVTMSIPVLEEVVNDNPAQINTSKREYTPGEVVTILLYKGQAYASFYPVLQDEYEFVGDVECDTFNNAVTIYGDFTVTNSGK